MMIDSQNAAGVHQLCRSNGELADWQSVAAQVAGPPEVRATAPFVQSQAMFTVDNGVKGVLVRVDSPGGGAAASQELYEALARLGKDKPIAVSTPDTFCLCAAHAEPALT